MYNHNPVHFFYDLCHRYVDCIQQSLCLRDIFPGAIQLDVLICVVGDCG